MEHSEADGISAGDEIVAELADELSRVRLRGLDAIDRNDKKQKPLRLPRIDALAAESPWVFDARPVRTRRIIAASIVRLDSMRSREAAKALFGIDMTTHLLSGERGDVCLRALNVPLTASDEIKKRAIRDLRYALAQALLNAAKASFSGPDNGIYHPADEADLSPVARVIFGELIELRDGPGATPARIEAHAKTLVNLPGVLDQYAAAVSGDRYDAAIMFLRCAARMRAMQVSNYGDIVGGALNLRWRKLDVSDRRMEAARLHVAGDVEAMKKMERDALIVFASLIVTLQRSPCPRDSISGGARESAQNLFALLLALSAERKAGAAEHLVYLIEEHFPGTTRTGIELGETVGTVQDWFSELLDSVAAEWDAWRMQYLQRIDPYESFLPFDLTSRILKAASMSSPDEWKEAMGDAARHHRQTSGGASSPNVDSGTLTAEDLAEVRRALRRSLNLLGQMLAHNKHHDYWPTLSDIAQTPVGEMPQFAIERISDRDDVTADMTGR